MSARSTAGRLLRVGRPAAPRGFRSRVVNVEAGGFAGAARSVRRTRLETGRRAGCRQAIGRRPAPRRTCCCGGTRRGNGLTGSRTGEDQQLIENDAPGDRRITVRARRARRPRPGLRGRQDSERSWIRRYRGQHCPAPAGGGVRASPNVRKLPSATGCGRTPESSDQPVPAKGAAIRRRWRRRRRHHIWWVSPPCMVRLESEATHLVDPLQPD